MSSVIADTSFSQVIRNATAGAHGSAQGSGFMSDLFSGKVDQARYARFLGQNLFIYRALENAAEAMRHHCVAGRFVCDELARVPAVEKDLAFLLGESWANALVPLPATEEYVHALEHAAQWSGGFVAHHYVRYLGDLSGGQQIAKFLARTLGLDGDGLRAFDFSALGDLDAFKQEYRVHLDEAAWTSAERAQVVDEILRAYDLATAMLRGL